MRLNTKLVLAITGLVFVIAGLLSLVYVSNLVDAAIQESYDANSMIGRSVRSALQNALETGLKDVVVDPNDTVKLMELASGAIRNSATLKTAIDSPVMYSPTVNDITITDPQSRVILTTLPLVERLDARPKYSDLVAADPITKIRDIYGPTKVFDIVVPQDRNGVPFLNVHVGVRTTFLQHVFEPSLREALTLMAFATGTALIAAFLLSNLALRPL